MALDLRNCPLMIALALLDIGTTKEWKMPTSTKSKTPREALPVNQRGLLSAEDAAAYLSISPRTFGKLVADGKIKRRKVESLIRFALADLNKLIDDLPDEPGRCPRID